jgi:hypothetical protein
MKGVKREEKGEGELSEINTRAV